MLELMQILIGLSMFYLFYMVDNIAREVRLSRQANTLTQKLNDEIKQSNIKDGNEGNE